MVEFQGADDFFTTVAEGGGKAYRFTDIDGIGPATADKITSIRGVQNPEDVAEMSADELSDKAGISHSRATKAIKGGGGNPNVSKQDNTGTVSAAGISKRQGDFWVEYTEMDKARARNDTQSRSEEAVRTDDRKRAPVTTDYEKWKKNPGVWDFPGVDTPTNEPNLLPKDVKKGDPNTADFDESGEAEFDEEEQDPFPRVVDSPSGIEILETGDDRVPATDVTRSVPNPDTFAPGVAPEDFEEDEPEPGPDVMGPEPSSQRLPETARQNLASGESADISFVQAEQSRSGNERERGSVPMQPYQSRNDGPPSQIGPYKLIKDSQSDAGREIAFSSDELDRSVVFQQYDSQEETEATVDVWWQDNAETVYEGSPDDAFEVFVGELEDRAEQNKKRTGSSGGIQSREAERAESLMNLFGV